MSPLTELIAGAKAYGWSSLSDVGDFESIATATGTGSSATISFTNIPSTYQHLQIRVNAKSTSGTSYSGITLNNDTASNYTFHYLQGNGTAASANGMGTGGYNEFYINEWVTRTGLTNIPGVLIFDLHDYASTSKYKTCRYTSGWEENGDGKISLGSGLWLSTAAVNRIDLLCKSGSWSTQTTVSLYGIKGA